MKFKASLLMLSSLLFLTSCGDNSNSKITPSQSNSVVNNSTSKDPVNSNSSTGKSDSNSKDTTVPFVKKELTVDNIYNDFLSLGSNGNFTIEYNDGLKDIYNDNYV